MIREDRGTTLTVCAPFSAPQWALRSPSFGDSLLRRDGPGVTVFVTLFVTAVRDCLQKCFFVILIFIKIHVIFEFSRVAESRNGLTLWVL